MGTKKHMPIIVCCFLLILLNAAIAEEKQRTSQERRPKVGQWEGDPSVSFEVTGDGIIKNFHITYSIGTMTCDIAFDKIGILNDGTFGAKQFMLDKDYKSPKNITEEERATLYRPDPIIIGKDKMIEVVSISGRFDDVGTVSGSFRVLVCEKFQQYFRKGDDEVIHGRKWSAKWKRPKQT